MYKKYILMGLMAAIGGMLGCALEDAVVSCGNSKEPLIGLIDDNPSVPVSSADDLGNSSPIKSEYFDYIKRNECPFEWYCVDVEDDGGGAGKACSLCPQMWEVMCGECVNINIDHDNCGRCGNKCSDYEKCNYGKCEETVKCTEAGMHASHGECVEDTVEECGSEKVNCTELEGWKTGECQNSACIAESCESDYALKKGRCIYMDQCDENEHLYGKTCEENDIDNCGIHGRQCRSEVGFEDGYCSTDGECVATSCQENFCFLNGVCHNGKYNGEFCGVDGECTRCKDDEQCENGLCIVNFCGENKHVMGEGDNTTCEEDSLENCGSHGNRCERDNVEEMACVSGKCVVKKCSSGYHLYEEGCEKDDINNCGSHGNQCASVIANWAAGECTAQECEVKTCRTGHVYNNTCEADSLANCGEHGKECKFDNGTSLCEAGECKLVKCDDNYFVIDGKCNPERTGGKALGGEYIDPWGLVWDKITRPPQPHAEAVIQCQQLGARLPTPTEIYRNNDATGEAGLLNNSAEAYMWTDTVGKGKDKVEVMQAKDGKMDEESREKLTAFRCVWDPTERPKTFTGVNCHGNSQEDGCVKLKVGKNEYIVDRRERPEQYWIQAAEECRKMGGRLPMTTEFNSLIRAGIPNGSNQYNWAGATKSGSAAAFKWPQVGNSKVDYSSVKSYRDFDISMTKKQRFRCISEAVKLVDNEPVFPQSKINQTFKADPLLRMDSKARSAATYYEAAYNCLNDGGHLPSIDEMTTAIRAGLKHDDDGTEYYWTSNLVSGSPTAVKFSKELEIPYYYAHSGSSLAGKSYKKPYRYYCAYRPESDNDYSGIDNKFYKVTSGGVTHYISEKNLYNNSLGVFTVFSNVDYVMRIQSMRIPTDTELVYMIKKGLGNGPGISNKIYVMTSNIHYHDKSLVYVGYSWDGRGNIDYDPVELSNAIKRISFSDDNQRPYRMYATTVIH